MAPKPPTILFVPVEASVINTYLLFQGRVGETSDDVDQPLVLSG